MMATQLCSGRNLYGDAEKCDSVKLTEKKSFDSSHANQCLEDMCRE